MKGLIFNEEEHKYYLDGVELVSVTTLLGATIFKDKYAGVSESVLKAKADKGTAIHEEIEMYNNFGLAPASAEGQAYVAIVEECGVNPKYCELKLHDERIAGTADVVYEDNSIVDIKTTYNFDHKYVSWQTSIYAYLYEKEYGVKVEKCYGIHLHGGTGKEYQVERKSNEEVERLIECYFSGEEYEEEAPDYITSVEEELVLNTKMIEQLTKRNDEIKAEIMAQMQANNVKSIKTAKVTYSVREGAVRETFDSKKFKVDHADIYGQYVKQSQTKPSFAIKLNTNN